MGVLLLLFAQMENYPMVAERCCIVMLTVQNNLCCHIPWWTILLELSYFIFACVVAYFPYWFCGVLQI